MAQATEHTMVGERSMGDARYDYQGLIIKWFDQSGSPRGHVRAKRRLA